MPVRPVVANNTPLVALWILRRLDLLQKLWGGALIPPAVQEEFLAVEDSWRSTALAESPWIRVEPLVDPRRALVFTGLDRGESEVLALAEEEHARLVTLDERKGRRLARRLGFHLTGSLGILLLAKERGLLSSVADSLREPQGSGLYLGHRLVSKVLELAGESTASTPKEHRTP